MQSGRFSYFRIRRETKEPKQSGWVWKKKTFEESDEYDESDISANEYKSQRLEHGYELATGRNEDDEEYYWDFSDHFYL